MVPLGPDDPRDAPVRHDAELVAAIRRGDVRAFERLFREHYQPLCRFAARLVDDASQAEDLVQSVFTTLWANRAAWTVERSERAYLFTAVRNAAFNHRRHRSVRLDWERAAAHAALADRPAAPDPDAILARKEMADELARALATLPARCRMVMELRWRDQLSYAEIAEVMGISVKGVENQLARGLDRVRAALR